MTGEAAFWGKNSCFQQMRVFWNPQDPLRRSCQAVQVIQIILAVHGATSIVASTGVEDFEAAQDVAQTKSIQYKLEPTSV